MSSPAKRKISVTLDAAILDEAKDLGLNVSAVAGAALRHSVAEARKQRWLKDNADAFAAQAVRHDANGHPLADIIAAPGKSTWTV